MAITQVGSATSATSSTAVTGLDFAVPTGIQDGDVLIATFTCNSANETRLASRWIALDIRDHGTWATTIAIKIADGADSGVYNFGIWEGTSMMVITCTAWRGVSPAWPCEFGESAHTSFATGQSEPVTTPTVSGSSVDAGRVLYIRTVRDDTTTAPTFSESTSGVTELVDVGTGASSVSYAAAQFADDADFSGAGSKSGLAITCSGTETHTSAHTIVLRAKGTEEAWTLDGTTTWTRPDSGIDTVSVECWGGGGGGGAGTANPGSGGGGAGGSYAIKPTFAVDGSSHTVTVASPVGNASGAGSVGQTTWFKANNSTGVVAVGGPGGAVGSSTSTGGAGGTGTTTGCQGDTVFAGGNGSQVNPDLGGSAGGGGASPAGAGNNASASVPGATKPHGGGSGGYGRAADTHGHQGMWYGGGGAGGNTTNATDQTGGWGGGGLVRIIWLNPAETGDPTTAAVSATANQPVPEVKANAECATVAATASAPTVGLTPGAASVTVSAEQPTPALGGQGGAATPATTADAPTVGLTPDSAASTATANDATAAVGASSGAATPLAVSEDASVDILADIGAADVQTVADDAATPFAPTPATAESAAVANDATSLISSGEANAGNALAESFADDASVDILIELEGWAETATETLDAVAETGAESEAAESAASAYDAEIFIDTLPGTADSPATAGDIDASSSFVDGPGVGEATAYDATVLVGGSPDAADASASSDTGAADDEVFPAVALPELLSYNAVASLGSLPDVAPVSADAFQLPGNGLFVPAGLAAVAATANSVTTATVALVGASAVATAAYDPLASIDHGPPDFRTLGILRELRVYEVEEPD